MLVLVKPVHHYFLENKLFELNVIFKGWHLDGYRHLAEIGAKQGIHFATWDKYSLDKADVILIQDLPATREEMERVRYQAPQAKIILMNVETPLGRNYMWEKNNHQLFDAILTYNQSICDEKRYFHYFLPIVAQPPGQILPFVKRRTLALINANRLLGPSGILHFRQRGLAGLPAIGVFFSGWQVGLKSFLELSKGETYSIRRGIARLAEREFPEILDIYGHGWTGEPIGWPHTFVAPKPFLNHRKSSEEKNSILLKYRFALAYENMVGNSGYISEKIFDCLYAGVVPIYLGEENIQDYVWASAFVDARRFKSNRELLTYVRDCPEEEWQQYVDQGQAYLRSADIKRFQKEHFAETILKVVQKITTIQKNTIGN